MDKTFVIEQRYDASVERVWHALSDKDSMREWYFPQLREFEPVVGFNFVFANDSFPYQKSWQVTKVQEGRLLVHSWVYNGYPGRSEVTFELFAEEEKTRLKLMHSGLSSFPDDPHFARQRFEDGWKTILGTQLKNFLAKK